MGSDDPSNVTYPAGSASIDPSSREICGTNPKRQDFIIGPNAAPPFAGYVCARINASFDSSGTVQNDTAHAKEISRNGTLLSGYAMFSSETRTIDGRVGLSFISIEQARKNPDTEIPDRTSLEDTARSTRAAWAEKLDRLEVEGASEEQLEVFYTGIFHALQVTRYVQLCLLYL